MLFLLPAPMLAQTQREKVAVRLNNPLDLFDICVKMFNMINHGLLHGYINNPLWWHVRKKDKDHVGQA